MQRWKYALGAVLVVGIVSCADDTTRMVGGMLMDAGQALSDAGTVDAMVPTGDNGTPADGGSLVDSGNGPVDGGGLGTGNCAEDPGPPNGGGNCAEDPCCLLSQRAG